MQGFDKFVEDSRSLENAAHSERRHDHANKTEHAGDSAAVENRIQILIACGYFEPAGKEGSHLRNAVALIKHGDKNTHNRTQQNSRRRRLAHDKQSYNHNQWQKCDKADIE